MNGTKVDTLNYIKRTKKKSLFNKIIWSIFKTIGLVIIFACTIFNVITEPNIRISGFMELQIDNLYNLENAVEIVSNNGTVLQESTSNNYVYTKIDTMPSHLLNAFISIEDRRFYSHDGIDYIRIMSALKKDILAWSFKEGGSTISQQLIKNTHLTNDKTFYRKIQEIRLAIELERNMSKEEIIESYLNILYFGHNIYGINSAAKTFFDKAVEDLSIAESALLAGVINNPKMYSPYLNYNNCLKRQKLVLKQMLKYGRISNDEFIEAYEETIKLIPLKLPISNFMSSFIDEAVNISDLTREQLFESGVCIETFLDKDLNEQILQSIRRMSMPEEAHISVIVADNKNAQIIGTASIGDSFNSIRQPGSTLKPLLCYAPAIEENRAVPLTPILDAKTDFNGYNPSNFKNKYEGWTTLKNSLINSSNVCAIKLLNMNGIERSKKYAQNCGISFHETDNGLSIALGGMAYGVTLNQLVDVYSMFAQNGIYKKSGLIKKIIDKNGIVLFEHIENESSRVFSESTAFLINDMLNECAKSGTARLLNGGNNICAKTGTVGDENGNTDAYCIAYSPQHTVAVWVGSKSYKRLNVSGGGIPTLLVKNIFETILPECLESFIKPDSITEYEIDVKALKDKHVLIKAHDLPAIYKEKAYFTNGYKPRQVYYQNISLVDDKEFFASAISEIDLNRL